MAVLSKLLGRLNLGGLMKKIGLSKGYEVTVDNEDYATGLSHSWSALETKSKNQKQVYATSTNDKKKQYLHREIMKNVLISQNKSPSIMKGRLVCFKNGNTLDCTRANLILLPKNMRLRQR